MAQVNLSKKEDNTVPSPWRPRDPQKVPDAVRSSGLSILAFFFLTHLARTSAAWGCLLLWAAGGSPFPAVIFRCPSALRTPARPLQVHRAGGCKSIRRSAFHSLDPGGCLAPTCSKVRDSPLFCHWGSHPTSRPGPGTAKASKVNLSHVERGEWAARWVLILP